METFRQDSLVDLLEPSPELVAVQALMPIDPSDRKRLKDDIAASGVIRDPIKVYKNERRLMILGGYNRWLIARELGFKTVPVEIHYLEEDERRDLVIKDNLNRRHLSGEQKRALIAYFLKEDPSLSDSSISQKTGANDKTVGKVRKALESTSEIPRLEKRKGADGKVRKSSPAPSKKKAKSAVPEKKGSVRLDAKVSKQVTSYIKSIKKESERQAVKALLIRLIKEL